MRLLSLCALQRSHRRTSGFTLIEVLAVVGLISVVIFVALNFYTDLARATTRASKHTHDIRRAAAIMDRVARDFEVATLVVKPPEMDPINHPWLFVGESTHGGPGADHVKFVTRNHDPTRSENPESDIAVVAYTVQQDEDGLLELYRWSSPRLPGSLERDFPYPDDEGSYLLADGLASFGIEFIGESGDAVDSWDSTLIQNSSALPVAVDIQLALANTDLDDDSEPQIYRRLALIRVRPLDFEELLDPTSKLGGGGGEDGEDGKDGEGGEGGEGGSSQDDGEDGPEMTLCQCIDISGVDPSDSTSGMWLGLYRQLCSSPWDSSMDDYLPPGARVHPACR